MTHLTAMSGHHQPEAQAELLAAANAIANARALRRGIQPKMNALGLLRPFGGGQLYNDVLADAKAALEALHALRFDRGAVLEPSLQFTRGRRAV